MPVSPPLPVIPGALLQRHHCFVPSDTRFRAAARLLQANWRHASGFRSGSIPTRQGGHRRLGSMLTQADADAGGNFLSPDLARLAQYEIAYRQPGALVHVQRLFANTLSSQPLALNLFGPLKLNLELAAIVMRVLLPHADIHHVTAIHFEHSPGRGQAELTNDRTAFDVVITYRRSDGARGFIGAEIKYSESPNGDPIPAPQTLARLDDVAQAAALYEVPIQDVLHAVGQRQLCREHLLAQAALIRGDWAEADFLLIAPQANHLIVDAAERYAAFLKPALPGAALFTFVTLEKIIAAMGEAGEPAHAVALHRRYTDFGIIDRLVADDIAITSVRSPISALAVTGLVASN